MPPSTRTSPSRAAVTQAAICVALLLAEGCSGCLAYVWTQRRAEEASRHARSPQQVSKEQVSMHQARGPVLTYTHLHICLAAWSRWCLEGLEKAGYSPKGKGGQRDRILWLSSGTCTGIGEETAMCGQLQHQAAAHQRPKQSSLLPTPSPPLPRRQETPTVIEEEQHGKSQGGGGQKDEANVARDHEVAHHQGDFVLVHAVPLQGPGRYGVLAGRHAAAGRGAAFHWHIQSRGPPRGAQYLQSPQELSFPRDSHPLAGAGGWGAGVPRLQKKEFTATRPISPARPAPRALGPRPRRGTRGADEEQLHKD